MTLFGCVFFISCAVCGYIIWRGSHSLYNAILGGFARPLAAMVLFGALVGRAEFEALLIYVNQ